MIIKNDTNSILNGILKYIEDLQSIIENNDVNEDMHKNNVLFQYSIYICLFQIGELSKFVPDSFKLKHIDIP